MYIRSGLRWALFGAVFISSLAAAQVQRAGAYVNRPGIMEFSGEMIVRPLQPSALSKAGKGQLEQIVVRTRARDRVLPNTLEYVPQTDEYIVKIPAGSNENKFSLELMKTGDYQYVEPNWFCYPVATPNDPRFNQQWHHVTVKSREAWDLVTGSSSVICAVVDTGIDLTHPDLAPNRVPGFNSVDRLAEVDGGQVNDLNGHGTHVAGDAAAVGNNSTGVCGMGWNFKIMMVRTSNSTGGGAFTDDILAGARWAAEHGAKSVSASYAGVDAAAVGTTGTYIKTQGALFLYAAGNDNRNLSGFDYPDTIVVGATNQSDGKADFSAYGRGVHVFAPGVNIMSTTNGGGYGNSSGTSMATPVTNGAVGLIFAANPTLTPDQAQQILESQCDNIGPSTTFGHGRINQFKNVLQALAFTPIDVAPNSISVFEGKYLSGTVADLVAPNTGGPTYDVASASPTKNSATAGVDITFDTGTPDVTLISLKFIIQAKVLPQSLNTGFYYVKNKNTGAWDLLFQVPLNNGNWGNKSITITSNANKYLQSDGTILVRFRAVAAVKSGRHIAQPFTLKLGHAKVEVSAVPEL